MDNDLYDLLGEITERLDRMAMGLYICPEKDFLEGFKPDLERLADNIHTDCLSTEEVEDNYYTRDELEEKIAEAVKDALDAHNRPEALRPEKWRGSPEDARKVFRLVKPDGQSVARVTVDQYTDEDMPF